MDVRNHLKFNRLSDELIRMTEPEYLKTSEDRKKAERLKKEYKNTNLGCQTIYNLVNNLLYYRMEGATQLVGEMKGTSKKDVLCVELDEFIFEVAKTEGIFQKGYDILISDKETHIPIAVGGDTQTNWRLIHDKLPFVEDKKTGVSNRHLLLLNLESYTSKYLLHIIETYQEKIKKIRQEKETVSEEGITKMEEKYKKKWELIQNESERENKNGNGI